MQDRHGADLAPALLEGRFSRLESILADGGYGGKLIEWARQLGRWAVEIVQRPDDASGFVVLPKRWIVERTSSWSGRCRRLRTDYETLADGSEAVICPAMTHLAVRRPEPCVVQELPYTF